MQIYRYILHILLAIILCSCNRIDDTDRLQRAQDNLHIHPDSTIAILDSLDLDHLGPHKAHVYLLKGKANLNLNNYPDAMESFLHAEKIADKDGNDSILILSRLGMMAISDSVNDVNEKARYALRLCEIYERHKDYDGMYDVLVKFKRFFLEDQPYAYADELVNYARILSENDTTRCYFYGDTTELRGKNLYDNLGSLGSPDVTSWRYIDGLKGFNAQMLINKIESNDGWKDDIANDSSDISPADAHLVATKLWADGYYAMADSFIRYYKNHYAEKMIAWIPDRPARRIHSRVTMRLMDRRKPEFRKTFQDDVKMVVSRFHYEEGVIKEQTIRHQRIVIIMASVIIAVFVIAIIMYLRLARMRRQRREDNNMRVASELRTALHSLEELHLATLSRLCETYYESTSKDSVKSRVARDTLKAIEEIATSPEFYSMLESRLNTEDGNAVTLLRAEIPGIKEQDVRLYLCNASGFSIPTMCMILNERREVIYNRRLRLRTRIQESDAEHRDMFLNHLR